VRSEPGLLTTIQGARGVAAIMVVLAHAGTILGFPENLGYAPFGDAFRAGHAGVDFFFVLSGFIIATVHARDIGRPPAIGAYAWKRVVRIYPVYWAANCIAVAIAALGFSGAISIDLSKLTAEVLLRSFSLVPQHQETLIGAAWTLGHEMLFYLMFALLIRHRGIGTAAMLGWLGWCIVATIQLPFDDAPWAPADLLSGFVGTSYHLQFGAGIVVAALVAREWVPAPRTLAVVGAVGFVLTAAAEDAGAIAYLGQLGRLLFGVSAMLVVGGLASAERRGLTRAGRAVVFLGAASYSVYLVHVPAMMMLGGWIARAPLPGWIGMSLLSVGGTAAGLVLHVVMERPALRALRGRRVSVASHGRSPRHGRACPHER
jgi:exopolysaccharide production protein ExoZ